MTRREANLGKLIFTELQKKFNDPSIFKVFVKEAEDQDGDPVLLVDVIFDNKQAKFDAKKFVGVVRQVRPALLKAKEMAFPIFSFVSREDASSSKSESV